MELMKKRTGSNNIFKVDKVPSTVKPLKSKPPNLKLKNRKKFKKI